MEFDEKNFKLSDSYSCICDDLGKARLCVTHGS